MLAILPALFIAEPPDDDTLVKPEEAFEVISDAESFAFVAVLEAALAASEVVEAFRKGAERRATRRLCLSTSLEGAVDMPETRALDDLWMIISFIERMTVMVIQLSKWSSHGWVIIAEEVLSELDHLKPKKSRWTRSNLVPLVRELW